MENNRLHLGLALTGSYCSFGKLAQVLPSLCRQFEVYPLFSENALKDSRFGPGRDWLALLEKESGHRAVVTMADAEPLGPGNVLDVLAIVPCTGNTLGKLAHGITDTTATMAAKGHLRNGKPLVIGVSTNDGLSASAENIGRLLNRKNIYFVPFQQDAPVDKPTSLSCDYSRLADTVEAAMKRKQLQPVLI